MKYVRSHALSLWAGALFFLASCNSAEEKKTETTTTTTDSTVMSTNTTAATNTIVTTPQHMLIIRHKVKDFAAWKMAYENHDSARLANGLHNYMIGRELKDSNMVIVALKADDLDKAKAFGKDPGLKQAMERGGVMGMPMIEYSTLTMRDTAQLNSPIRSLTEFQVKSWDTWQKKFAEGKQERIDNGLADRAYGHDVNDSNKVQLVVAVMDTAKAYSYWKSDILKQRRAASGVIGEPKRFVYRVVQRY